MKPFLQQVANLFYQEQGANIEHTIFVFPSRRASVFFQQYLLEIAEETFFAPACYTLSDFFKLLTPQYESEDKLGLLFRLYRHYQRITGSNESFDSFMSFGEILLKDFNDIDNYLVNAKHIFSNLADLKQLEDTSYLTEAQKAALERYLGFISKSDKDFQSQTGAIWSKLYQLYNDFTQELLSEKLTYDGLQHRIACQLPTLPCLNCDEVVFVGFNALDGATKHLFRRLQEQNIADFYWDYQSEYINDANNKAHYFMETNLKEFPSKRSLVLAPLSTPTINLVSVPSSIGQTKYVADLLQHSKQELTSTAVVLANEQLLIPMLYAMPENAAVNITMGYPLKQTSVRKLIDDYLLLQITSNEDGFYHTHVASMLNHPYIKKMYASTIDKLDPLIHQQLRVKPELLQAVSDDFYTIFAKIESTEWLSQVDNLLCKLTNINDLDKELVEEARLILVRLQGLLLANSDIKLKPSTLLLLIRKLLMNVTLSFIGEPIHGLQMMGMLETRCLDFNQLIITSFNEGIYPKKDSINTYIPYSIRGNFGLPTTEHQDAIYAYNFYRLIQRANQVYLIYDTRKDSSGTTGEISRFAKQLQYVYRHPAINQISINCTSTIQQIPPVVVQQKEQVRDKVLNYLTKRGLSASALNDFIGCHLKFYLAHIEGIRFNETISEEVQANQFGTIYHYVMEHLYAPHTKKEVLGTDIDVLLKNKQHIDVLIERAYASTLYNLGKKDNVEDYLPYPLKGIQLLTAEIIKDYVIASLKQDQARTPFYYMASEASLDNFIEVPGIEQKIKLKGFVDRIEEKDKYIQIYDYKTSNKTEIKHITNVEKDINHLFIDGKIEGQDKILQLCFYYLLAEKKYNHSNIKVHLYFVKKVFEDALLFNTTTERVLPDGWKDLFIENLNQQITKMLQVDELFTLADEKSKTCDYCKFKAICGR